MPLRLKPTFREALAGSGRALYGGWVVSGSTVAAEIMAGSGLDYLLIDMEHGPLDLGTVQTQLQVIAAYDVTALVRVPYGDGVSIKRALDLGAQNLVVPMVSTPEQALAVARAAQYPPVGVRGVGSALARSARWNRVEGYLTQAADHVCVIAQIETLEAVENAAAIASTPGIDAILIGPADLAASMGVIGQQGHPDVVAAVNRVLTDVKRIGKPVGVNAFDPKVAKGYAESGADFLLVGADVTLLARGSEDLAKTFLG